MTFRHLLVATTALTLSLPTAALAQTAPERAQAPSQIPNQDAVNNAVQPGDAQQTPVRAAESDNQDIVVTARQREERLQDVPIAVTAVSGDFLKDQQVNTVRDVAAYAPGLIINSDSASRSFVSIRGIGTTLIDTVQPGVGIFVDGVYQPNTSYLNTPIVDIARIEVLRGPQGTLFGNNTLGGAINVITRQPSNEWHGRVDGAYAGTDDFESVSANISGPIIRDRLQFRIGAAFHKQDNFQQNTVTGDPRNPLNQKSVNGTLRILPTDTATLTLNANYDRVFGGFVPYANVAGPREYTLDKPTNVNNYVVIIYKGANLKGEFNVRELHTKITAIAAYNQSDLRQPEGDADFGPIDFFRATSNRDLKSTTGEVRFDTQWSDNLSTLIGVFANRYTTNFNQISRINLGPPIGFFALPQQVSNSVNESRAVFGTAFLKIDPTLDFAVGLRYDHQKLNASTAVTAGVYEANQLQPRATLTKRWMPDFMTYASVARGVRGGGQNDPGAPNLIYRGDSVWTYELGTKFAALDRKLTVEADVFYNDYKDFIGPNALAPSTIIDPASGQPIGFVAVNLNAGHVSSYGFEGEIAYAMTEAFRLYGNITLLHARVTDARQFQATTGYAYAGDRIPFVPSINFTAGGTYRVPIRRDDNILLDANVIYKGKRQGDTLDETRIPILAPYALVNGSVGYRHGGFEIAAFTTNLFNSKYIETYLDSSLLSRAGLGPPIAANLAIQGQRRRYGVRASFKF